jgi:pimeloyl-ACP methyl ester carboxylesterase
VTKEELFDAVWGTRFVSESALTTRIKEARQAVGDDGKAQRVIKTVHGRGYRFVADVGAPPLRRAPAPIGIGIDDIPRTQYAESDGLSIAYQTFGEGPPLVFVGGFTTNVEVMWEYPAIAACFRRLASFSRVIVFDKRGTGLSDRPRMLTLETQMDDIRAVLDAVGSERAALLAAIQGSQLCALFAATYPERIRALVLYHPHAAPSDLPPIALRSAEDARDRWGTSELADEITRAIVPSLAGDGDVRRWFADSTSGATCSSVQIGLSSPGSWTTPSRRESAPPHAARRRTTVRGEPRAWARESSAVHRRCRCCTPESASCTTASSRASRSALALVWRARPEPARWSSQER